MKLVSCYIENYGAISRKEYSFNEGITGFLSANGTGKTTLASFIKAMFYGLSSYKANSKAFEDRQRFYPFNGGKFGGNLTFEYGGSVYRIERFFDKKSSARDEVRLFKNGKPYEGFNGEIGKAVFGLDVSAFERTVFLTAEEIEITSDGDVNAKLNREVSASDDYSLENALKELELKRKDIKADRGKGGLLDREKELRVNLSDEIADLNELKKGLAARYEERNALECEIAVLAQKVNAVNEARLVEEKWATYDRYQSDLMEKRARIAGLKDAPSAEELAGLNAKCAELERTGDLLKTLSFGDIAGSTDNLNKKNALARTSKVYFIVAVLAVLFAVGGVCACFFSLYAGIALIALGLVGLFLDGFLYLKKRMDGQGFTQSGDILGSNVELCNSYRQRIAELQAEILSVLEKCGMPSNGEIRGAINNLLQKRQLLDLLTGEERELSARAEKYKADILTERAPVYENADEAQRELEEARKRLALIDRFISEDEENIERLPFKENRRERADERIAQLKERYELITLTEKFLKDADRNLKDRYVKPVKDRFDYYAENIKAVLGGRLIMSEDFSLSFESGGEMRSGRHLSAGQRSVCGLCLRLALIDNMYEEEKPFIVMDDPFVNLDGENISGVLNVLRALAKEAQIIYFTCHNSREI